VALQVAAGAPPAWAAGALLVLSEVLKSQPSLWAAIQQPEDDGGGEEHFTDEDGSESDGEERRRRKGSESSDDEGLRPLAKGKAAKQRQASGAGKAAGGSGGVEPGAGAGSSSDSGDEGIDAAGVDLGSGGSDSGEEAGGEQLRRRRGSHAQAGPSRPPGAAVARAAAAVRWPPEDGYQADKREPLHCHAERSCWWELCALASHAHPSVAAWARSLMSGAPVVYDGDPLKDMSVPAFLDKYLQKKPKAHARGSSLMQPLARPTAGKSAAALGAEAFAALALAQVEPADVFFHKFYAMQVRAWASRARSRV
jgi:ribosome biogenesis protein MAK21